MNDMIFLKPKDPAIGVTDPKTRAALPSSGALVPRNSYWLRRLAEGDVVEANPAPAPKPSKEK